MERWKGGKNPITKGKQDLLFSFLFSFVPKAAFLEKITLFSFLHEEHPARSNLNPILNEKNLRKKKIEEEKKRLFRFFSPCHKQRTRNEVKRKRPDK